MNKDDAAKLLEIVLMGLVCPLLVPLVASGEVSIGKQIVVTDKEGDA